MKKNFLLLIVGALFIYSHVNAQEVLGKFRITSSQYNWRDTDFEKLNVEFRRLNTADGLDWYIDTDNIGQTFTSTSNDPAFEEVKEYLSDGVDTSLGLFVKGPDDSGGGNAFYESETEKYFNSTEPDFMGYNITSVSITVLDLIWEYPVAIPHRPESGEVWNYVEYDYSITIEGTPIPEPCTLLLLGLGGLALRLKREKI